MVNFAEGLQDARDPEWRDYYVNYIRLKGWLKEIEASGSVEAAQHFFDELTLNMQRVEAFYISREDALVARAERELKAGPAGAGDARADTQTQKEEAVTEIEAEINRLCTFADVNMEGLRKIAKKFDKTCGSGQSQMKGSNYGRDKKGARLDWGLAKEALQPRLVAKFPSYRFGTASKRLGGLRERLQQWRDDAAADGGGRLDLQQPLISAPARQNTGLVRRQSHLSVVLHAPKEVRKHRRFLVLRQCFSSYGCSAAYFLLVTVFSFSLWAFAGFPGRHTPASGKEEPSVNMELDSDSFLVVWVTIITLTFLVWQWPSDCVMLGATLFLHMCGLISSEDAWGAFANEVVLSVAALSIVGDAVSHTGFIDILFEKLIGNTQNLTMAMLRIYIPCALGAASISNTCVMACSMPAIEQWCKKSGHHIALFFMPVSFIMLIAGTFAIFSTSTNMVAQALLVAHGMEPLGQFDLAFPALMCSLASLLYLVVVTPISLRRFLKSNREHDLTPQSKFRSSGQSFYARMRVLWRMQGEKTIADSGLLANVAGGISCIHGVERHGIMMEQKLTPEFPLHFDDIVVMQVNASHLEALRRLPGLEMRPLDGSELYATMDPDSRELAEVILDQASPLVGQSFVEAKTFSAYSGALVAIRVRAPEKRFEPTPELRLAVGDQVVLDVGAGFCDRMKDNPHFVMVRKVGSGTHDIDRFKAYLSGVILLVMLFFVAKSIFSLFACALGAIFLLVVSGCATVESVKKGVRLSVVLTIVGAFGLGHAISKHGVAQVLASYLVATFQPLGHLGLLVAVSVAVVALGVIFHGTAVVALMFPLCTQVASASGIPQHQMVAVLCISSALQMLSPVSYNTNLMAYAACPEYEFKDFPKLGGPLVCLILLVGIPACQWWFPGEAV